WPIVLLVLLGLGAKTLASAAFFSPGDPFHWATPGGQIGLAAGAALLGVCLLLPARSHAMLAGMALLVATALVNLAPENPFLPSDAAMIRQGNFLNFHGLTQLTASLWPFVTFAYLGLLGASAPRDSLRGH
nr:VanZ family protein [Zoogloea sp.]